MDALLTSTIIVTLAEIGDKTQLLAMILATRYKRPVPIILGILFATIANHFLAAFVGHQAAEFIEGRWFRYVIGAGFILMAAWTLLPDTLEEEDKKMSRFGAFTTTLITFFFVEMGDKTQVATIALGAQFDNLLAVTAGTTLGMMIANVPAVILGNALIKHIPMKLVRYMAALLFLMIGIWTIWRTATLSI
ncbi:TMEM165/GDT1 family protein [Altericroceibacterium spongiae]|uniref:GDT1 family protein n=1 Tax=Altericroceibacterium spongiae TaxID=2320269 RepID=A0A420EER1_9SPHN|nr:TMEM165/GDT1 family protein [Altericroceibacterium spongiae]RKF19175.1 TMEM165/GDT1 family protein [Altericroceibacterium spongiae]